MNSLKSYQRLQRLFSVITILVMILSLFNGTVRSVQAAASSSSAAPVEVVTNVAPVKAGSVGVTKSDGTAPQIIQADSDGHWTELATDGNFINGWGWPNNASINLTIDDPSNGHGIDYSDTGTVKPAPWGGDPDTSPWVVIFQTGSFNFKIGDIVTLTDGVSTHIMTIANLKVTNVDPDADTVSGFADAGAQVAVEASTTPGQPPIYRHVTADESGNWTANFHVAGAGTDSPETFDIVDGSKGSSKITTPGGDLSDYNWYYNALHPYVQASVSNQWVFGRGWDNGSLLTLTIDDPSDGAGTDYSTTATVQHNPDNPGDPNDIRANFPLGEFKINTGMQLTVTDGITSRTLTLASLVVTSFNVDDDTVSGTADPDANLQVLANGPTFGTARWVTAGDDGHWTANFHDLGGPQDTPSTVDLVPGSNGWAEEGDAVGNVTHTDWNIPNPYVEANANSHWLHGRGWPKGTPVTLTIDDPSNGAGVDFTAGATMGQAPWNPGDPNDIVANFDLGDFQLHPGMLLTITDGAMPRTLTLSPLQITSFDADNDFIYGTTNPGLRVQVCVNAPTNGCVSRWTTADDGGNWSVNFHDPGGSGDDPRTANIQPGTNGRATDYDTAGNQTNLDWNVPNPYVQANVGSHWVQARDWPKGDELALTIDDPSNGTGVDYSTTATYAHNPNNPGDPNDFLADFPLGDYQLHPGMLVTVTDGTTTVHLTISSLQVTAINVDNDTISGTTESGGRVQVCANNGHGCTSRRVTADGGGNWTVNYHNPGGPDDDAATVDLQFGSSGWASQVDVAPNQTWVDWSVLEPSVVANMPDNYINSFNWPLGASVTVTIEDPGTPQSPDFTTTVTVGHTPWDSKQNYVHIQLDNLTLQPGQIITVTDGVTTKTLTVAALNVTGIDAEKDTISGTAPSGAIVYASVNCNPGPCPARHTTAGNDGSWSVDFSVPGSDPTEQIIGDIQLGSDGQTYVNDNDNNSTFYNWREPNPRIVAFVNNRNVGGDDWPLNTDVNLTIVDPSQGSEIAWQGTTQAEVNQGNPNSTWINFDLGDFTVKADDVLTMSYGSVTKTLTMTTLSVNTVDPQTDTISGDDVPGANLEVWIDNTSIDRWITVGSDGHWSIDFSTSSDSNPAYDLVPGTSGQAKDYDADGDSTQVGWRVNNPYLQASVSSHWVQGRDWPVGNDVSLSIDDPTTPADVDYSTTATVEHNPNNPGDPNDIGAFFDLGNFQLHAGMLLNATDGVTTKSLTISPLQITSMDVDKDTISGSTDPGAQVQVCANIPGRCITRWVTADKDGNWTANYSVAGGPNEDADTVDLVPGSNGWAAQIDVAPNQTWVDWNVPNPFISANVASHWVEGRQWPIGSSVTLTIDDPTDGVGADYTTTAVMGTPPWDPGDMNDPYVKFDLGDFQLHPGMLLSVTDGVTSRTLTLTGLQITHIDVDANTISGVTNANTQVQVCLNLPNNCISRWTWSDDYGNWSVDYSKSGTSSWDSPQTYDIQPGDSGWAADFDSAGNQTQVDWKVLNPYIETSVASHWLHAREWPNGTPLTLTIDDPTNGVGVDFTAHATMGQAPWNPGDPNDIVADFDLGNFQLHPGMLLTMTDGTTSRSMTIADMHITQFDLEKDMIYGTADPNARVQVCANITNGCTTRLVTADGDGNWVADFHNPGGQGDDPATFDLQAGSNGWAAQKDGTGYQTWLDWSVPAPRLDVWFAQDAVDAYDFPANTELTLTVQDDQGSTLYSTTAFIDTDSKFPTVGHAHFDLSTSFDIVAGQTVTVTGGGVSKSLLVKHLTLTSINITTGQLTGTADPDSKMWICAWLSNQCNTRNTTPDDSGIWLVDFSKPGDGNPVLDLKPGVGGGINIQDEDGDNTSLSWAVPMDTVHVNVKGNEVHGHDWPIGDSVTLTVDNDNDPGNGVLYTHTETVVNDPTACGIPCFHLDGTGVTLQTGQVVTMSDAEMTKTVVISTLEITDVDYAKDTLSGVADPNSNVMVNIWSQNGISRQVQADGSGNWQADFSTPGKLDNEQNTADIVLGDNGRAIQLVPDMNDDGTLEYWSVPNPPADFTKSTPANAATNQSLTPTLGWTASGGANSYQYCYSTTSGSCTSWTGASGTSVILSTPLTAGTKYYWQVRAINSSGQTDANSGSWYSFTTQSVPGSFGKNNPAKSAINQPVNLSLSWGLSPSAASYQYCYDTTNDGNCTSWKNAGAATSVSLTGLARNTTYFWQVRALNGSGNTPADGGIWWSFTTIPNAPAAFNKSTPANAATNQSINLALNWAAASGADSYEYCIDTTNNGACDTLWASAGTSHTANLISLNYSTTYYWQVRATNAGGTTYANAGSWYSFTTQVAPPSSFKKTNPVDGLTGTPLNPTLSWTSSAGATSYSYCVDTTNDSHCDGALKSVSTTSVAISGLAAGTIYYWQVYAVNPTATTEADGGVWHSFTTLPLPSAFAKTSPLNAAVNQPATPLLSWAASSNAASYQYCYDTSNDGTCTTWLSTTGTSVTLPALALNTTYYWQVRAVNTSGNTASDGGAWWSFKTLPAAPTAFSKTAPANAATGIALSTILTWGSAGVVDNYSYCLDTTNNNTCDGTWTDLGGARTVTPGELDYNTTYYWQVRATNYVGTADANAGAWWSFTTQMPPIPGVPVLTYPANAAVITDYTPALEWNDVTSPAPDHYNLQISLSSTFSTRLYDEPVTASSFPVPAALDPGKTYYWRVQSVNYLDGTSSWVLRSFKTGWLPPALFAPLDHGNLDNNRPNFIWSPIDHAASYNLQVSRTSVFSSTLLNVTVSTASFVPTADLPANTTLFWHVRTNGTNGPSAWSGFNQFTTANPPGIPSLTAPANGLLLTNHTPTLIWGPVSVPSDTVFANYLVQASPDPSFQTDLLVNDSTLNTPASSSLPLTVSLDDNTTYYWRVMSYNTAGQHSSWSNVWSFDTQMLPPLAVYPANLDHALTVRPQFSWQTVNTATSYSMQVSKVIGFSTTVVNVTITGLSYIPVTDLPRGVTLYWRLKANGANPSNWSTPTSFTSANPPAVPGLTAPDNLAVLSDYTPAFSWATIFGASHYQIQVASASTFTDASLVDQWDGTATTYTPASDYPTNATLYWRVRSLNPAGEYSFWSASRSFKTTLPAPGLLAPTPSQTGVSLTPLFDWSDVLGATGYTIQVSTSSTFSTTLINKTVTASTFTAVTALPRNKQLYWRVKANGTVPSLWTSGTFKTMP